MSTSFKTSMFGGFDRSDVIAYIEKTGREHEERVAALEAENETLRKENQTLENTQRVTQAAVCAGSWRMRRPGIRSWSSAAPN